MATRTETRSQPELDNALQDRQIDEAGNVPNVSLKAYLPKSNVKTPEQEEKAEMADSRSTADHNSTWEPEVVKG